MPQGRPIKQISTAQSYEHHEGILHRTLYALCEDGTVWICFPTQREPVWELIPPIPLPQGRKP